MRGFCRTLFAVLLIFSAGASQCTAKRPPCSPALETRCSANVGKVSQPNRCVLNSGCPNGQSCCYDSGCTRSCGVPPVAKGQSGPVSRTYDLFWLHSINALCMLSQNRPVSNLEKLFGIMSESNRLHKHPKPDDLAETVIYLLKGLTKIAYPKWNGYSLGKSSVPFSNEVYKRSVDAMVLSPKNMIWYTLADSFLCRVTKGNGSYAQVSYQDMGQLFRNAFEYYVSSNIKPTLGASVSLQGKSSDLASQNQKMSVSFQSLCKLAGVYDTSKQNKDFLIGLENIFLNLATFSKNGGRALFKIDKKDGEFWNMLILFLNQPDLSYEMLLSIFNKPVSSQSLSERILIAFFQVLSQYWEYRLEIQGSVTGGGTSFGAIFTICQNNFQQIFGCQGLTPFTKVIWGQFKDVPSTLVTSCTFKGR